MIDFTPIARAVVSPKAKDALRLAMTPEDTQRKVLEQLIANGARTKWGKEHGIQAGMTYEQYAAAVPVQSYEAFRPYAMRMVNGEADVLWPGVTRRFAQSSGTSGGKSKYIPITSQGLKQNHYAGASLAVALYLLRHPESKMFSGLGFILGGSFANELDIPSGVKVGDLSANLIQSVSPIVNLFRIPGKDVALMEDWEQKLPALADASFGKNVTNISGVPSWFLTVLKRVLQKAQRQSEAEGKPLPKVMQDVWPGLEVFFHGGISFAPYRDEYAKIMAPTMRYWETYNASEGFFAAQSDIGDKGMLLLQNVGVFYEFIPLSEVDKPHPRALTSWQVQSGKTYALAITTCNGLWRYAIGDTVKIESVNPLKITIAGRTQHYINAFGEELMVCNADAAIAKACAAMGCTISNYTVAPVYANDNSKGRHQWLVEWLQKPQSTEEFANVLDECLQKENSDYQAKRHGGIFLDRLELLSAPQGLFDQWLGSTGKLGGQRKIPRLSNDRRIMDQLLEMARTDNDNKNS